jgi:hypothetical protein
MTAMMMIEYALQLAALERDSERDEGGHVYQNQTRAPAPMFRRSA